MLQRLVLLALLVGFVTELAVTSVRAEPYPALFQPSFAGTPLHGRIVDETYPTVTLVVSDGTQYTVDWSSVLPKTKLVSLAVFNAAFRGARIASDPRTVEWLRTSLRERYPGVDVRSMTIRWYRRHVDAWTTRVVGQDLLSTVTVRGIS